MDVGSISGGTATARSSGSESDQLHRAGLADTAARYLLRTGNGDLLSVLGLDRLRPRPEQPPATPAPEERENDLLLTRGQVASRFGLSPQSVDRWVRDGRLGFEMQDGSSLRRFRESHVRALLGGGDAE
jgi:excisionase family DNA binding protein